MSNWYNYFVTALHSHGTEGHIPADTLRDVILNHDGGEAYHCAYELDYDRFKVETDQKNARGKPICLPQTHELLQKFKRTVTEYDDSMRPALGYVWFDFDSHDGGAQALADTREFVRWLAVPDLFICYSGSKGFHVGVPFGYFPLAATPALCTHLNQLASHLKNTPSNPTGKWKTLDTTIYNANRKFRALGSCHPKTGLYKIKLTFAELLSDLSEIKALAKERGDLTIPIPELRSPLPVLTEALRLAAQPVHLVPQTQAASANKEWTPPSGEGAFKNCAFLQYAKENQAAVNEPQWYAALSIVSRFANGRTQCHEISNKHPKYSVAETNSKIDQALLESGPRTCANVSTLFAGCRACPLNGKINSPVNIPSEEEKKKPREIDIARAIIEKADGNLIRQEDSIFRYRDGHWKELNKTQIHTFKKGIMDHCNGFLKSKDVDSVYRTLFRELPAVPDGLNLFDPHPFCANFQNGTLHVRQSADFQYSLEFLKHDRTNYLSTVIPFDYDPNNTEVNVEFENMLMRVFDGDADQLEKIRAVKQMFGACLIPAFPHFFFLWGKPGTGKSTVMQLAAKLMSQENICSVEPNDFSGFNMETMIGKLVNIETDVDTQKPINDAEIKKVIDRRPMRIKRKGIADLYGMLPAIHLFGGNALPPTLEGALGAHDRRWTFIGFQNVQTKGQYNKEFHNWVFNQSPQGILNFALDGLKDILECRGHYFTPTSGKEKMREWQSLGDTIALFLDDIKHGEVFVADEDRRRITLRLEKEGSVSRSRLYDIYVDWAEKAGFGKSMSGRPSAPQTRNIFFNSLRDKGFQFKIVRGNRFVDGFSLGFVEEGAAPLVEPAPSLFP